MHDVGGRLVHPALLKHLEKPATVNQHDWRYEHAVAQGVVINL